MKAFEQQITRELLEAAGLDPALSSQATGQEVLEFSGSGYFISIKDPTLPKKRMVLDKPFITGKLAGIEVGYLAFVEQSELLLECYSVIGQEIRPQHRDHEFLRDSY